MTPMQAAGAIYAICGKNLSADQNGASSQAS
jgi:hypothetical protein